MLKQIFKYLVVLTLAILLFLWVVQGVDRDELMQALRDASVAGLILAGLLNVSHNIFRVLRWKVLLRPVQDRIPFLPMFSAVILGYMTTWIVPGRLGELVRPALLTAREKVPLGPCLGSVLADRLMDMVAIVILFAVGIFSVTLTGAAASQAASLKVVGVFLMVAVAALIGTLVFISIHQGRVEDFLARRGRLVQRVGRTLVSVARGTEAFRSPRLILPILFYSLLCWLTINLSTWVGLKAAGVDVSIWGVFVLQPALALGFATPLPAGVGAFHVATQRGLMLFFKVGETAAVGAGILLHLVSVIPIIVLGTLLFWIQNYSMADIRSGIREVKALGAGPVGETS